MSTDDTYDNNKLILNSERDGWMLGYIGIPWPGPWPKSCGDLFVRDLEGGQAGIAWDMTGPDIHLMLGPGPGRWGVFNIRFPYEVMSESDLIRNFHAVLPRLKEAREQILAGRR